MVPSEEQIDPPNGLLGPTRLKGYQRHQVGYKGQAQKIW